MKEKTVGKNKHILNTSKHCPGCGQIKDRSEFSVVNRDKGYIRSRCKECWIIYCKEYRLNNKEKIKETQKRYYQKHRSDRLEYQKQYNIDKTIEYLKGLRK